MKKYNGWEILVTSTGDLFFGVKEGREPTGGHKTLDSLIRYLENEL